MLLKKKRNQTPPVNFNGIIILEEYFPWELEDEFLYDWVYDWRFSNYPEKEDFIMINGREISPYITEN